MRLIISRMPALDAALARFDSWWSTLSTRERMLVSLFGALLALAILIYGAVKPLQAARAQAIADIRMHETLTARIRAAGTLSAAPAPRRQGTPQDIVTSSAQSFGLTVVPEAMAGGVRVTVADASYDSLMAWLADLSATSDLRVRRIELQRVATAGHVSATMDLGA